MMLKADKITSAEILICAVLLFFALIGMFGCMDYAEIWKRNLNLCTDHGGINTSKVKVFRLYTDIECNDGKGYRIHHFPQKIEEILEGVIK